MSKVIRPYTRLDDDMEPDKGAEYDWLSEGGHDLPALEEVDVPDPVPEIPPLPEPVIPEIPPLPDTPALCPDQL